MPGADSPSRVPGEEAQSAIHEYVVRNAPEIMKEIEEKMATQEEAVTQS